MSGGSAPTLLIRLPSTTMTSLRAAALPDPSIRVPLRISKVFLAEALIRSSRFSAFVCRVLVRRAPRSIDLEPGARNDLAPLQHLGANFGRERLGAVAGDIEAELRQASGHGRLLQ